MSVSDRLARLMPPVSTSSRQTDDHPPVCLSPPLSLSSPVIKKKAIKIPSFDEKGLIYERNNTKQSTDRSFLPICSSKTSSQPCWSKSCQRSLRNYGERASTLPRTKPKTYSSPTLLTKPSITIFPAPNSSPTPKSKPRDSLHLPTSQFSDPSLLLKQPQPKPSVSPTLTVRLSPSPTSLCQGGSLDNRGDKQPSPVAKERRARSITISNAKVESIKQTSSNEAKHDILDQEALLDFTHPALRRACSRHHTESQRPAAMSQSSCLLQGKIGLSKREENTEKDKPKPPPRKTDITSIPKPKSNIKQQQEFLPSGTTGIQTCLSESEGITLANVVQRQSQSAFDVLATQSSLNLHRKHTDYPQRRNYTSSHQSYEQMYSERSAASPTTPRMSFSTEPLMNQSPNVETRRRRFDFSNDTKVDTTCLSYLRRPKEDNNIQTITGNPCKLSQQASPAPQKHRFQSKALVPVSQSDCGSKDYSCHSRDIDQETESPRCTNRLNRFKACLVATQTQEASRPAAVECDTSKTVLSHPGIISHKHQSDHKQNKNHTEVNLSDRGLNQMDIFAPPDHHGAKLLEYPSEKYCLFNTNSFGISSKGVFDLPSQSQHRVKQRPDETTTTTASPPQHRPHYSPADRTFIMEEPDDPYYVTMYYPGSVYVVQ